MASIQHDFAPNNTDLNCLDSDQSYFDGAKYEDFSPLVQSSPPPFSPGFVSSSSSAAAPTPAFATPNPPTAAMQQQSPLFKPQEPLFGPLTDSAADLSYPTPATFTSDADSETPLTVVAHPPPAKFTTAVDPLPPPLPPSFFELQPVTWTPFTPNPFVAAAFTPVSFASSQSVPVILSATNPDDHFAKFWQPIDDSGLDKRWDVDSLVTIRSSFLPEANDFNTDAPLGLGTTQFPIMESLPTLPAPVFAPALESVPADALTAALVARRRHNSRQAAKVTTKDVTIKATADAKGVPAKRKPGRPKLPEGAPKGPYKKRSVPEPLPSTPPKPKRVYKEQFAATVD